MVAKTVLIAVVLFPVVAFGQEIPTDLQAVEDLVTHGTTAFQSGQLAVAVGAFLMAIVAVLRRYHLLDLVPTKYLPLATTIIGSVTLSAPLLAAGVSPMTAILTGLTAGLSAPGLWEVVKPWASRWVKRDA